MPPNHRMRVAFRTAKKKDLERLVEIETAAYPDPRSSAARERDLVHHVRGPLRDMVVAEVDGDVVASAFLFALKSWFGGRAVAIGGVASVAVAPEARGRGTASALMKELHRRSHERGDALTLLYPFRQGFYARLGYANTPSRKRLRLAPASIPRAWSDLARASVVRAKGDDRASLVATYEAVAKRRTGWLARSDRLWERRLCREDRHHWLARQAGTSAVDGYLAFVLEQSEVHGATTLIVEELVARSPSARRVLLGALGAMRDQISTIELEIAEDDPLEVALLDVDGGRHGTARVEHDFGTIVGGPMIRLDDDLRRSVEARGYRVDGRLAIRLHGERPSTYVLEIARGRAKLREAPRATSGGALVTDRAGLAALLYGGLPASQAAAIGVVDAPDDVLQRADALLAIPKLWLIDPF